MTTIVIPQQLSELASESDSPDSIRQQLQSNASTAVDIASLDNEEVHKAIEVLREHQHEVPPEVRIPLIQDLVSGDYNQGVTQLASDLEILRRRNPVTLKVLWMILDAVLIKEGLRVIRDQPIQDYVGTQKKARKKGFIRRWLEDKVLSDAQKQTALIQEGINLAAENDGLKRAKAYLRALNEGIAEQNKQALASAATEVRKMMENVQDEIKIKQTELGRLEKQIALINSIKERELKDPAVAQAFMQANKSELEELDTKILHGVLSLRSFNIRSDEQISTFIKLCKALDSGILKLPELVEKESGAAARISVVAKVMQQIQDSLQDCVFRIPGYGGELKLVELSDWLAPYLSKNESIVNLRHKLSVLVEEEENCQARYQHGSQLLKKLLRVNLS